MRAMRGGRRMNLDFRNCDCHYVGFLSTPGQSGAGDAMYVQNADRRAAPDLRWRCRHPGRRGDRASRDNHGCFAPLCSGVDIRLPVLQQNLVGSALRTVF